MPMSRKEDYLKKAEEAEEMAKKVRYYQELWLKMAENYRELTRLLSP